MPSTEREIAALDRCARPRQLRCDRRLWPPDTGYHRKVSSPSRRDDRATRVLVPIRARLCRYRARFLAAAFFLWSPPARETRDRPPPLPGPPPLAGRPRPGPKNQLQQRRDPPTASPPLP